MYIFGPGMRFVSHLFLVKNVLSYDWVTDRCNAPNHGTSEAPDSSGLSLSISGTKISLESSTAFRGFLLTSFDGFKFANPPSGTTISDICGKSGSALMHTSSTRKTNVSAGLSCTPTKQATLTAWVVYSHNSLYGRITETLRCGEISSPSLAAPSVRLSKLNYIDFQWTPRSSTSTEISATISTGGRYPTWAGIGFGESEYRMNGNKPSILIFIPNSNNCQLVNSPLCGLSLAA